MASAFQDIWQTALEAEKELLKNLAEKEPTFTEVSHFLSEFRAACQNAILQDFETARSIDVEGRLWDAHLKINTRFRKLLARFRERNGKKKPVERRKLEKHYLDFVKSSQQFYRGYIQHLSSHFGGIVELEQVARKFNFDNLSAQPRVETPNVLQKRILQSCHATLIRLGDLSRYRETELVSKDRNWGPAIGYYDLASLIHPPSGASHNQLAVIALADGNHLKATYHLYRALTAQEAHPSAKGNLEIEFKKVLNAWAKRELIRPEDAGVPGRSLAPWFVYLHAQCYKGVDFPEHDELENEVISQLAVDLKERSLEDTLQKFCLINIAAEDFSRAQPNEESGSNARQFFQRINVKTFFTLLQILLTELERFAGEEPGGNNDEETGSERVTVVARRILPVLRHYSSWLLAVSHLLAAQKEDKETPLFVQIKEFWKIYANTLTLLTSTFDVVRLPEIGYLLEEDEETLGFAPLAKEATSRRYLDANGQQKPRMGDLGVERNHPNIEMLYRVREFVIDGLDLVVSNRIPIVLVNDEDKKNFMYKEEGLPSHFFTSPRGHHHTLSSTSIGRDEIPPARHEPSQVSDCRSMFDGSQSATTSVNADMHRIVEGVERLVESDAGEGAPPVPEHLSFLDNGGPPTPQARFFEPNARPPYQDDSVRRTGTPIAPPGLYPPITNPLIPGKSLSQSYTPRPALPGIPSIWNTAFSPQVANTPSPRTPRAPPGLGQLPVNPLMSVNSGSSIPSQDQIANDLFRRNIIALSQYQDSIDQSGSNSSPWLSLNPSASQPRFSGTALQRDPFDGTNSYMGSLGQPPSSGLANASWANNAFIGSSLSSGMGYPSSGFSGSRRSASQLGAIGQTPPCGQGG